MSFQAIRNACESLPVSEIEQLKCRAQIYLDFRRAVEDFQLRFFEPLCRKTCYDTGLSACCGFESIITFFADQVITFLFSQPEERAILFHVLEQPNTSGKCVFLGKSGCIWRVRPIACSMFLCDQAKDAVFEEHPEARVLWGEFKSTEKEFTWPVKPVLFDELEKFFLEVGVQSPHLYFHQSPGLLRVKARSKLQA